MKKLFKMLSIASILLIALLILGCSNGDSDSKSKGEGVLGQISGVVYNTVIAQPLKDVNVEIGGLTTVKTDANGSFLFKNVKPGIYTVSFQKDGFQFRTRNVEVDAKQYLTDDPFMEKKALEEQFAALMAWIEMQKLQGVPDFSQSNGNWQYSASGVWVDGNGTTVQVKQNENKQYVIKEIKLDYTYSKGQSMYIMGLAPLTGTLKANIKLFTTVFGESRISKLDAAVDIGNGIEFWFEENTAPNIGFSDPGNAEPITSPNKPQYGPVETSNGGITFTGLPVGVPLRLISNSFLHDNAYVFKQNPIFYQYQYTTGTFTQVSPEETFIAQNSSAAGSVTDVGTLYLFTEGNFALVSDIDTGSRVAPKKLTDSLSLTFSEDIDPATFMAYLATTWNSKQGEDDILLAATWLDPQNVTLVPAEASYGTGGLRAIFPYSWNELLPVGSLSITGKAVSGAKIYNATSVSVYTEEGIKLIETDINPNPGDIPARVVVAADAIKLTFNKEVDGNLSYFRIANPEGSTPYYSTDLEFSVSADKKSVYIYTNILTSNAQILNGYVVAEADVNDDAYLYGIGDNTYEKAPVTKLILNSTNIYDNGFVGLATKQANFPVAGTITLTFNTDIPTGADVDIRVGLVRGTPTGFNSNDTIAIAKTASGKVLSIKPEVSLLYNTRYSLAVEIYKGSDEYFSTWYLGGVNFVATSASNVGNYDIVIGFTTEVNPIPNARIKPSGVSSNTTVPYLFVDTSTNTFTGNNTILWDVDKIYYIQFTDKLTNFTPAASYEFTTPNTNLYMKVVKVGDYTLAVRIEVKDGGTAPSGNTTPVQVIIKNVNAEDPTDLTFNQIAIKGVPLNP